MLRNGYDLLIDDTLVGDETADGDVVEVFPDPEIVYAVSAIMDTLRG